MAKGRNRTTSSRDVASSSPVVSPTRDQVHHAALLASIAGRPFEDVKFFTFSRRNQSGEVVKPLSVLSNSTLIRKASSHFDFMFTAGFAESGITDLDAPYPSTRSPTSELYDYTSDSDLEDEDEVEERSGDGETQEDDKDDGIPKLNSSEKAQEDDSDNVREQKTSITKPGRVIFLDDIAYLTWKAFVFYAYTGEVDFAPLKSEQKARSRSQDPYKAPLCSPKSMYRIAHKYDIPTLKVKATNDIKSKLSPHNILEEIFSTFTSLYPDIQAVELEYLHSVMKTTDSNGVQDRLHPWLTDMEEGRLPKGAANILASLISKLSASASGPPPQPGMRRCPGGCTSGNYRCNNCNSYF